MGKIVVATYLTLDGVMESPSWTVEYWEDVLSDYQDAAQKEAEALLLGRVTFQQFAQALPESRDEGAAFMNGIQKYVPTHTLRDEYWNARFLRHDVMNLIAKLGEQMNLLVYGSAELTRSLFFHGLVDEYREMVFPIVLGEGKKLFEGAGKPFKFGNVVSIRTPRNVLLNTYTR